MARTGRQGQAMGWKRAWLGLAATAWAISGSTQALPEPPPQAATPATAAAAAAATPAGADWSAHLRRFQDAYFVLEPTAAVAAGRHAFDGQLPDLSAAGLQSKLAWLLAERQRASAWPDSTLTPRQRFERDYLLARIDTELFWLRDADLPHRNPAYYLDTLDPSIYLTRPYAPLAQRLRAFIAFARALPTAAAQIRSNLRTPLPKTFADLGVAAFGGMPRFLRVDVPKVFAGVPDSALQRELQQALEPAAAAMQSLAAWVKAQASGTDDTSYALGPQGFADMLQMTERVGTPLAELQAIGRADLGRNTAALKQACAQLAPGASVKACVARVNADKPRGGPIDGARAQLGQLRQFIVDQDLVSIPGEELAQVALAPEFKRWNFAYIDIAGPYEKHLPATYYIAPPDPKWTKAVQADYLPGKDVLLFTSVHEVWPGHFLQFMHANHSDFGFGQVFVGYAFAEGWAHYAEQMMWDAGLGKGAAAAHIGQLSEALLRDVRFLCAIGLHTQGMRVQACEAMFKEQAFQDAGNARQQAARGTFDPAYLNYTMGKLMIMKLRADWTASRGGRAGWKAFHDQFLSFGGPPIPLLRQQMLGSAEGALF